MDITLVSGFIKIKSLDNNNPRYIDPHPIPPDTVHVETHLIIYVTLFILSSIAIDVDEDIYSIPHPWTM